MFKKKNKDSNSKFHKILNLYLSYCKLYVLDVNRWPVYILHEIPSWNGG